MYEHRESIDRAGGVCPGNGFVTCCDCNPNATPHPRTHYHTYCDPDAHQHNAALPNCFANSDDWLERP